MSDTSEIMEQTFRILCGDHTGIKLFNALHETTFLAEGDFRIFAEYDENGEDGLTYVKSIPVEASGDGVNFSYLDKNG